ncbi:hypothetical protein [Sphingomonas sp. 1P08PE]|uniref:hypothetical protein n=1 Tax=Sphingomonas sp. 1P08PE TaxID=554122 RepID=UPI0039A26AF6
MTALDGSISRQRRAILPLILAASLLPVTGYYVTTAPKLDVLRRGATTHLLAMGRKRPDAQTAQLAEAIPAIAADPLNQQAVSGVIAARLQVGGDTKLALQQAALLRQLGWRSTSALQNLLWRGGSTRDLPLIMDTLDALLRRQKLLDTIYPLLNLMTVDPDFRILLTRRLTGRPSWRYYYFLSATNLKDPAEINGRFAVMRAVQRSGDRLTRNEIAPILPRLLGIGRGAQALALWRTHAGALTSPLADPDFAVAARPLPDDALPISFEWQLANGSGYYADASRDAQGNFLSIDWSGRGTPVFVSQVTSATPGRYRLLVTGDTNLSKLTDRLGFRLTCPDGRSVAFTPQGAAGRQLRLLADGVISCAFPTLELHGLVQSGMAPGSMTLRSIQMMRAGA